MQKWIFDIRSRPFFVLAISFLFVALLVYSKTTQQFDESTVLFFQSIAGNPIFDIFMQSVTEAGDVFYMLAFGTVLVIIKKTRKIGVVLMILLVLTTLLTGYIKCGIDRDRPNLTFLGTPFLIESTQDTFALFCEGGANASFPSGHASRATVFGMVLGFALSQKFPRGCYLLLLYPILMSISRVYVLQHFPMDVIGGIILGILLTGVVAKKAKLGKIFELKT
ncbi:MAG: phosphatase PAP2 family protein [Thaumarchaeota archaeon]|nr:phosphatase PAP2 family protein [Nitrososphaerota archaeon]